MEKTKERRPAKGERLERGCAKGDWEKMNWGKAGVVVKTDWGN